MNERQTKIFEILSISPAVNVKELAIELNVSEVTIRKDLSSLENEGFLKRTHGGAVQVASDSIEKRIMFKYDEKLKIAREAAKLVKDGETVLIEAGSTNAILAKELSNKDRIHIITNSLYIANMLKNNRNAKVTLLGGEVQEETETMVGPLTKLCLSMLAVNKVFIGMDGFSEKLGFTSGDFLRAEVAKEMCYRAEKIIILAEASKFNNIGMTSVVDLSKVSMVITNDGITDCKLSILEKNNIQTQIV